MVRMTPPDRLPAFDLTLPGDISTAALPIACVVASPLPRRLVIEDVGINETRTASFALCRRWAPASRSSPREWKATSPSAGSSSSPAVRFAASRSAALRSIQSMIDELPMLAALAARADGRTVIRDAQELKDKDTDRIATTVAALEPVRRPDRSGARTASSSNRRALASAKSLCYRPIIALSLPR